MHGFGLGLLQIRLRQLSNFESFLFGNFLFSFFFEGAPVFVEEGRLMCHGTMAQWPVQV